MPRTTKQRKSNPVAMLESLFPRKNGEVRNWMFREKFRPYMQLSDINVPSLADIFFEGGSYSRSFVIADTPIANYVQGAYTTFTLHQNENKLKGQFKVYVGRRDKSDFHSTLHIRELGSEYLYIVAPKGVTTTYGITKQDVLTGEVLETFGYGTEFTPLVMGRIRVGAQRTEHRLVNDGVVEYLATALNDKSAFKRYKAEQFKEATGPETGGSEE